VTQSLDIVHFITSLNNTLFTCNVEIFMQLKHDLTTYVYTSGQRHSFWPSYSIIIINFVQKKRLKIIIPTN